MLKELESRILTLEEIKEGGMYWMEGAYCDGIRFKPIIVTNARNSDYWVDYYTTDGYEGMTRSEYGRTWRCWSSRPTDEQRKAVK